MKPLLIGIMIGFLIYAFGIPVLNQISDFVCVFFAYQSSKMAIKTQQISEEGYTETGPIGFVYSQEEEEDAVLEDE